MNIIFTYIRVRFISLGLVLKYKGYVGIKKGDHGNILRSQISS